MALQPTPSKGAIFIAGAAVQWLRDGLGIIASSEETDALASSLNSNEGVYFVPALVGMGSPWWYLRARHDCWIDAWQRQSAPGASSIGSMAYQMADVAEDMQKTGIKLSELRVDGGATKNAFMIQFQADLLGVPVRFFIASRINSLGCGCPSRSEGWSVQIGRRY